MYRGAPTLDAPPRPPPPYRILNILAYYRWSLALPSTLRKGISSVASTGPRHRVWTDTLPLPTPSTLEYATIIVQTRGGGRGGIRAKPVCLWHLSALFQPRISLLPRLWEIIAQRYLIRWRWSAPPTISSLLSILKILLRIVVDLYRLGKDGHVYVVWRWFFLGRIV